jgi:outer membrane protein assembly factor BamB
VASSCPTFVTGSSSSGSGIDFVVDYATVAYSSAGELLWSNFYNGPENGSDSATAIAVDSSGNVFVTGDAGRVFGLISGDYATIAYSSTGVPLWTNRYNGPGNGYDSETTIAVDSSGNVFVTGTSWNGTNHDFATLEYSNAGVPLWTNRYNGPGVGSGATAIAVDSSANVIVTGVSEAANGRHDYATVAYSNSGVPLWTNRYDGPANGADIAIAIAVDSSGNVFVTGHSEGTDSGWVTIKYSSSVPPPRLDFQLLSNEVVLSWTNAGFTLQSAPIVTGTFTNIPAATSPYTNALTGPQQFFRLKGD